MSGSGNKSKLVILYQQMADHTLPECKSCKLPLSCCSPEYCEMTIKYAKRLWDVDLSRTDHAKLPLMGENGCTAAPHLRPLCTVHTCQINSLGWKPGDKKWSDRYFDLRDQIGHIEFDEFGVNV